MAQKYRCVLLFGAPGVGKGTQGKRLGQESGLVHLATGDMFRGLDKSSRLGQQFVEFSSRGELVPDELTVALWHSHVEALIESGAYDPERELLVLDGIPRSLTQARMLADYIDALGIVHLIAPDIDDMVARMMKRAETEGRHDDVDEMIVRRRFEVYARETAPVLGAFDASLVHEVDAIGTMDEVTDRVRSVIMPLLNRHVRV